MTDLGGLLRVVGLSPPEVRYACRVGSHVYGTAHARSDEDFVIVRVGEHPRDLVLRPTINVTVQGEDLFAESLRRQNLFALECRFAPIEHRLVDAVWPWKLERAALIAEVTDRATADFEKAMRTWNESPDKARKRLFHALRVPLFGAQILRDGALTDFTVANAYLEEILTDPSTEPEPVWRPIWEGVMAGVV